MGRGASAPCGFFPAGAALSAGGRAGSAAAAAAARAAAEAARQAARQAMVRARALTPAARPPLSPSLSPSMRASLEAANNQPVINLKVLDPANGAQGRAAAEPAHSPLPPTRQPPPQQTCQRAAQSRTTSSIFTMGRTIVMLGVSDPTALISAGGSPTQTSVAASTRHVIRSKQRHKLRGS